MSVPGLNARALISIPEARRYVWRDEDDSSRDGILIDAVNDISDAIWDHCKREFRDTTAAVDPETFEARDFEYDGSGVLNLSPFDLRELDGIVMYSDLDEAQQVELGAGDFRLKPIGGARGSGTYLEIALPVPSLRESEFAFGWQVTVAAKWGMAEVPGTVKLACKEWVENIVKNPGQFATHAMSGYTVVPEFDVSERRAGMPPSVRYRLLDWERDRQSQSLRVLEFRRPSSERPAVPHRRLPTA